VREHDDGGFPFANDFNALVAALTTGSHVVDGVAATADTATGMTVDIAAGTIVVDSSAVSVAAQSVTLDAADPDSDRYDLLVAGTDGSVDVIAGTPSGTPKAPAVPDGHVLLAIVGVTAGTGSLGDGDIFDVRVDRGAFVPAFATYDDIPAGRDAFTMYWVEDEGSLYVEDGQ